MIVATILFVLSAGSAVLAKEKCDDPDTIETIPVDLTMVAKEYFYCGSYVEGQKKPLCSLDVAAKDANSADLTLKGKKSDMKKISMTLIEGKNGTYNTTLEGDDKIKLVTYITGASEDGKCMSYVKCFTNGMWYGSKESGTFSAVVCTDKKDCDKKPAKEIMDKLKGLGKIKKC